MDEKQIRAFIGGHADYYLKKWNNFNYTSRKNTWNWAGFIFSVFWLAYRKMYTLCGIYCFFAILSLFILLSIQAAPVYWTSVYLAIPFLIGTFGNRMYYHFIQAKLTEVYAENPPEKQLLARIAAKGGTEFAAVVILSFILLLLVYGIFLLFNTLPTALLPANLWQILF